jgi:hypothetical protein
MSETAVNINEKHNLDSNASAEQSTANTNEYIFSRTFLKLQGDFYRLG